ncbi:MAG: hypothetical protein HRU19_00425 [Pseudobacteriovorax sp.]|nr:hypothetical protein [Pseudobacteriovorax sp.]
MNTLNKAYIESWLKGAETLSNHLILLSEKQNNPLSMDPEGATQANEIELINDTLKVGNIILPLGERPKTATLVRAFWDKSEHFMGSHELLQTVYKTPDSASQRLYLSDKAKLTKLMSRTRSFLTIACQAQYYSSQIRWLDFDKEKQGYYLYRRVTP